MRNFLIVLIIGFFYCPFANAQLVAGAPMPHSAPRSIRINYITRDSVNLALNEEFDMIEDSCSQVIRYGHMNMRQRKFFGKIKDVSKLDTSLTLTEGNYNADGLKDGYFITHYLNGKLQAKGSFKNNQYDGKWEMYYDDGKPKLFFEANGKDIKIMDAWDAKGAKIIDNGKGNYRSDQGSIYWKGKLLNGKPDGTWSAIKANDASNAELVTEKFKDGAFQKGSGPLGGYTDASRLELVTVNTLPFTRAELMRISMLACGVVKHGAIVSAQFKNGAAAFSQYIIDLVGPVFGKIDVKKYLNEVKVDITAEVAENGIIVKLFSDSPYPEISEKLISQLQRLPALYPATIDGKPARQKIVMTFTLEQGIYRFNYRLLPVAR